MTDMAMHAERAVDIAKGLGRELDYTIESVKQLDELAEFFREAKERENLEDDLIRGLAGILGAYLGEVLLRNGLADRGLAWLEDEEGDMVVGSENCTLHPLTKVYKRITYGPGDELLPFCLISFAIAD